MFDRSRDPFVERLSARTLCNVIDGVGSFRSTDHLSHHGVGCSLARTIARAMDRTTIDRIQITDLPWYLQIYWIDWSKEKDNGSFSMESSGNQCQRIAIVEGGCWATSCLFAQVPSFATGTAVWHTRARSRFTAVIIDLSRIRVPCSCDTLTEQWRRSGIPV